MPLDSDWKKLSDELDKILVGQKFNAGLIARSLGIDPIDIERMLNTLRPSYNLRYVSINVWMKEHPATEFERRVNQVIVGYPSGTRFTALDVATTAGYAETRGGEVLSYLKRMAQTYQIIQPADELTAKDTRVVKVFRKV